MDCYWAIPRQFRQAVALRLLLAPNADSDQNFIRIILWPAVAENATSHFGLDKYGVLRCL